MKIALAHDWLTNMGGAEVVISKFAEIYKEAPIYTSVYNPDNVNHFFHSRDIRTSFLQKFERLKRGHQKYFPFMPTAWEQFDFNNFDVVLSSSSSCAKGIVTSPDTMHVCYCHTPMRYAWEYYNDYLNESSLSKLKKLILPYFMNYMRMWDAVSANRVDYFIANSKNVARRIYKHYRRESDVIYPPVQSKFFTDSAVDDGFFLVVSRLVPYKKVDLAVEAFNELKLPLVVIGGGEQFAYLKSIANSNVKILGRQPDKIVLEYYAKCTALVFPGEEDLGLTPIEAQASGKPVIAYGRGGAVETVVNNETGLFFSEHTVSALKAAILELKKIRFDRKAIIQHASNFKEEIFKQKIEEYIAEKYNVFCHERGIIEST